MAFLRGRICITRSWHLTEPSRQKENLSPRASTRFRFRMLTEGRKILVTDKCTPTVKKWGEEGDVLPGTSRSVQVHGRSLSISDYVREDQGYGPEA
jgi:hypothetical protein